MCFTKTNRPDPIMWEDQDDLAVQTLMENVINFSALNISVVNFPLYI